MAISKKVREQVFNKTGGKCGYCGCELTGKWHVDHMMPLIRYKENLPITYKHEETEAVITDVEYFALCMSDRTHRAYYTRQPVQYLNKITYPERDHIDNLLAACQSCNINKGNGDVEGFRFSISNGVQSLNKSHAQYRMGKRFGLIEETAKPVVFYFETFTQLTLLPGT